MGAPAERAALKSWPNVVVSPGTKRPREGIAPSGRSASAASVALAPPPTRSSPAASWPHHRPRVDALDLGKESGHAPFQWRRGLGAPHGLRAACVPMRFSMEPGLIHATKTLESPV